MRREERGQERLMVDAFLALKKLAAYVLVIFELNRRDMLKFFYEL